MARELTSKSASYPALDNHLINVKNSAPQYSKARTDRTNRLICYMVSFQEVKMVVNHFTCTRAGPRSEDNVYGMFRTFGTMRGPYTEHGRICTQSGCNRTYSIQWCLPNMLKTRQQIFISKSYAPQTLQITVPPGVWKSSPRISSQ